MKNEGGKEMEKEIRNKIEDETPTSSRITTDDQKASRRKVAPPRIRNNGCMVARTIIGDLYFDEYGNPIGHVL